MTNPLQSALEVEIVAEQAATMGHLGRKLEKAIRKLEAADDDERDEVIGHVAYAAWSLIVHREVCGLRDHRGVIRHYRVPKQALNRMGAMPKRDA